MPESPAAPAGSASPEASTAGVQGTPSVPAAPASQPSGGPPTASNPPASAPSAAPAPSRDGTRNADGTFRSGPRKPKSQLSPIPDLPGVFDSSELAREGDSAPDDPSAATAAAAAADGSAVPPAAPAAPNAPPAGPLTPSAAGKFKFGGQEWDSQEKAEQSFQTLRGQFRSMDQRVQDAVGHANRAVDAAVSWQRYAQELEAKVGSPAAASPQNPAQPAADAGVDWGLYQTLVENHGEVVANIWLNQQNERIVDARVSSAIEKAMGPILPVIQEQQTRTNLVNLFTGVAASVDPATGSPAYPELNDASSAEAIMLLLSKIGLTPEQAMTPMGVHLAVAFYRDQVSRSRPGQPSVQPTASAPAAAAPPVVPNAAALAAATAAAAAVASGVQPPVMQPAGSGPNGGVLAQIRNARDLRVNEGLGFSYE